MKPPIIIRGHLGLGDHLITNALVRYYAQEHEAAIVPCKLHNFTSVRFMWGDLQNVFVVPVVGDEGADAMVKCFAGERLKLGMFGEKFSFETWDKCMYDQAGVSFFDRWDKFYVRRSANMVRASKLPYIFLHEDSDRGYVIDRHQVPGAAEVQPQKTETIFDWMDVIANAEEIHCIDSSFAILVDSMKDLKASRLVLHLYARENARPPIYKKKWEVLR